MLSYGGIIIVNHPSKREFFMALFFPPIFFLSSGRKLGELVARQFLSSLKLLVVDSGLFFFDNLQSVE